MGCPHPCPRPPRPSEHPRSPFANSAPGQPPWPGFSHPSQMVALCPNCHAMKERGLRREELVRVLLVVARDAHGRWLPGQGVRAGR